LEAWQRHSAVIAPSAINADTAVNFALKVTLSFDMNSARERER